MIIDQIEAHMRSAMREKDTLKLEVLRDIKLAFDNSKTEKNPTPYSEGKELVILQKLAKARNETIEFAIQGGRKDMWEKEKKALHIIKQYLPQQMDPSEITDFVREFMKDGVYVAKDMGVVIKNVSASLGAKAQGSHIAAAVKLVLSEPKDH